MYLEYFDLKRHPFRITPDPTLFCPGGGRGEVLEALIYAITSGEGIVKVVGEVGSGKTMLCRILEERLPESVEIVYLANPKLSPRDILHAIAFELKLPVKNETERLVVMQHLQAYLLGRHAANRSVVVFVEEAQGMPLETLEEIRLLSNLETHRHKLLQIVLFGQPELDKNLRKREIRQLKERITHSFYLGPLTRGETSEYLRFRLQAAGCGRSAVFGSGTVRLISRASCGLIRRINILADKAMLAAYADPADTTISGSARAMVQPRHARAAIRDSEFRLPFYRSPWFAGVAAALLLVVPALILGWNRLELREEFFWPGNAAALPALEALGGMSASVQVGRDLEERHPDGGQASEVKGQEIEAPVSTAEEQPAKGAPPMDAEAPASEPAPVPSLPQTVTLESRQGTVVTAGETLMEQRRKAGGQWLEKIEPNSHTVQLMAVEMSGEVEVERFLQQVRPVSLLDRIYVCQVSRGERRIWVLVYGDFPGVTPARKAIDALPPELRRFQPFVRPLDGALRSGSRDGAQG